MKPWIVSLMAIVAFAAGWLLRSIPFHKANATTEAAHRRFDQQASKIISLAESMPANKYAYAPKYTDDYFMEIVNRVTSDTLHRCAQLTNIRLPWFDVPPSPGRPSMDAFSEKLKDGAVKNLKDSIEDCDAVFRLMNDSQLHDLVAIQGDRKVTKAEVMMDLLSEIAKSESEMDTYLRLSGAASRADVR